MIQNDAEMPLTLEEERRRQEDLDLQCAMPYAMFVFGVFVFLPIVAVAVLWATR